FDILSFLSIVQLKSIMAASSELELQQYLRSGQTLEDLTSKYGIKVTRHKKFPELVCFKYNQIRSKPRFGIVRESRGIILDESRNWEIVSFPFMRFFNR